MSPDKIQFAKTKREKTLLLMFTVALFLVGYFHFFIKPAIAELSGLLPKVYILKRDIAAAKTLITGRPLIEKERDELKGKIDDFGKIFPREREIPKLLENLSNIAKASGVKIIGIKPLSPEENKDEKKYVIYQKIPIEIIARSGYHQLGEFIQKLEMGDRFIMVRDIDVSADKNNVKVHDVRLIAVTYILIKK